MRNTRSIFITALLLSAAPAALQAQDAAPPAAAQAPGEEEYEEIIVNGAARERGAVEGNIQPEQRLNAGDIRAFGVSSIAELLTELAPQTNAAGGSPVVLLNGKRISSFSEIQDIPSEAIQRVEILPEEVSLTYGYAANQKVVNVVLRRRFNAITGEARGGITTDGGRENGQIEANVLRIQNDNRLNLNIKYTAADSLLESERNIKPISSAVGDLIVGSSGEDIRNLPDYRTLSPSTNNLAINGTLARALPGGISGSINGRLELSESDSLQGLQGVSLNLPAKNPFSPFDDPAQLYRYIDEIGALAQGVKGTTAHLGLSLNGEVKPWRWSFTGAYDYSNTRTRTERGIDANGIQSALVAGDPSVNPFASLAPSLLSTRLTDSARAKSSGLTGDLLVSGPLFDLPAGKVTSSFTMGLSSNSFDSDSLRSGIARSTEFSRDIASGQANIDIPITSRRNDVLSAIGDLSLNGNAQVQHLSDFGTLSTLGYGVRWTPIPAIRFIASVSEDRNAPTGLQVNNPLVVTPNISVFDYARGETVFVSQIGGGNPALSESNRHTTRLGLTLKPFEKTDITLSANYTRSRTDDPIANFPTPTPQIEAAFPDRFVRDADGVLVQVDTRPINFSNARSSELRWGVNYSMAIKSSRQKEFEAWRAAGSKPEDRPVDLRALFGGNNRPNQPGGQERQPPREGGAPDGGFGRGGPRGAGGPGGGRIQFALFHTWHISDTIQIGPGIPKLDLLDGDAVGSNGGSPRHELQAQAGYSNNGLGFRLSGNWQSGTHVNGALGATNSTLRFSDLATADLRLFADLGQMPKLALAHPFFRGSRVSLNIKNLFNSRQDVTDATGATPLRYQPDYLDPLGRTVTLSFRKLFF